MSATIAETLTVNEWQAKLIERAANVLCHFLETTPAEKHAWTPNYEGAAGMRSALDQIGECSRVNRNMAMRLRRETPDANEPMPTYANAAEATADLRATAKDLADTIRSLPASALTDIFVTGFGDVPGAVLFELPQANMHYHAGQICQIQMLCGDEEFHVPPGFAEFF